jgi:hypothetical protein
MGRQLTRPINLQEISGMAKAYQVRLLLAAADDLGLTGQE